MVTTHGIDGTGQLAHILELLNMCRVELILRRFDKERALLQLGAKYERARGMMCRQLQEKRRMMMARRKELCGIQGGSGAFSLLFTVTEDDGPINVVVEENEEKK